MGLESALCLSASIPMSGSTLFPRRKFLPCPTSVFFFVQSRISSVAIWSSSLSDKKNAGHKVCCSQHKDDEQMDDDSCELVNGVDLSIGEGDDSVRAYLFKAVKNNNGTGILLLSDVFGFQDSFTRDFAYRVACNGYNVLVPDLFRGDPWTKNRPKSMFDQWLATQNPERVTEDIAASTSWLVEEFVAAGISKKLGIIGFSFGGGRVIEVLAEDQANCFGLGVSFYGTRVNTSIATKVRVPILLVTGDSDSLCPVSLLKDVQKSAKGSKVVTFKERGHDFAHRPQSPEEDDDAEQAFLIMRNWLYDGLVANNALLSV